MPPSFQCKAKQFLLTIPQDGTPLAAISDALNQELGNKLRFAVISAELHLDGSPHRHLYLQFREVFRLSNATRFDFLTGQHCNIQKVGKTHSDQVRACRYVMKDKEFVLLNITQAELDLELEMKSSGGTKVTPSAEIVNALRAGTTVSTVLKNFPAQGLLNLKKIQDYANFLAGEKLKIKTKRFKEMKIKENRTFLTRPQDVAPLQQVCDWFNQNIFKDDRPIRTPQLWLYGPPGIGKSSLIAQLSECLKLYLVPAEDWDCGYEDDLDLAVLDEFTGYKTLYWMNRFLDGSQMPLKKKGMAATAIKTKNIPVLVLSNNTPQDVYKEAASKGLAALDALAGPNGRVLVIEIGTYIRDLEIIMEEIEVENNDDDN